MGGTAASKGPGLCSQEHRSLCSAGRGPGSQGSLAGASLCHVLHPPRLRGLRGDARVISSWMVLFCTLSQEGWDRASQWVLFWPRQVEAFLQPLVHQ